MKLFEIIDRWFHCRFRNLHKLVRKTEVQSICPHCGRRGLIAMTTCCKLRRFVHPDEVSI